MDQYYIPNFKSLEAHNPVLDEPREFENEALKGFTKMQKLGEGTYGIVYKARSKGANPRDFAIKRIKQDEVEHGGLPGSAVREVAILNELDHPNIIPLVEIIFFRENLYMIFPYYGCDLRWFIDHIPVDDVLHPLVVKCFLWQITQALCYCHQRRIIHRDLKPQNILLDGHILKIADFGMARAVSMPVRPYTQEIVTLWYRAPEVILGVLKYSTGVDIWSIGCMFAELILKEPLFPGDSEIDQCFRYFRLLGTPTEDTWCGLKCDKKFRFHFPSWRGGGLRRVYEPVLSSEGIDLLESMLVFDPCVRISAKGILKSSYFNDLDKKGMPSGDWNGSALFISKKLKEAFETHERKQKEANPSGQNYTVDEVYNDENGGVQSSHHGKLLKRLDDASIRYLKQNKPSAACRKVGCSRIPWNFMNVKDYEDSSSNAMDWQSVFGGVFDDIGN